MRSPFLARVRALADGRVSGGQVVEDDHEARPFASLYQGALRAREALTSPTTSLDGRRVAILLPPGAAWIEAFLGVLAGGGVAVPLSPLYPPAELSWFADDAGADTLIVAEDLDDRASAMAPGRRVLRPADLCAGRARASPIATTEPTAADTALLLYTSGTTGKPKGARITHGNLAVQAELLRAAW